MVDLPQPEPPMTATISPGATVERDAVERAHAVGIGLADAIEDEHRDVFSAREAVFPAQERRRDAAR